MGICQGSVKIATIDDKWLWVGCEDGSQIKYDTKTFKIASFFGKVHKNRIVIIEASACGRYQFTCDKEGFLTQWKTNKFESMFNYAHHVKNVKSIAVCKFSRYLYTMDDKGQICKIDIKTGQWVLDFELNDITTQANSIKLSPKNDQIFLSSKDHLLAYNASNGKYKKDMTISKVSTSDGKLEYNSGNIVDFLGMVVTHNSDYLLTWTTSGFITKFCLKKMLIQDHMTKCEMINNCIITPDDKTMYESTSQGWIKEYDLQKKDMIEGIVNLKKNVTSMVCTSNSRYQYSCCLDENIAVWDSSERKVCKYQNLKEDTINNNTLQRQNSQFSSDNIGALIENLKASVLCVSIHNYDTDY